MTVAIMSVAFVAILSALAVTIRSQRTHEVSANTNIVLVAAAEAIKAAEFCDTAAPAECPDAVAAYETVLADVDLPSGWDDATFTLTITQDASAARAVQDITVEVTSPDGRATRTLTVAKAAPPPPDPTPPPPPPGECAVNAHAFQRVLFGFIPSPWVFVDVNVTSDPADCAPPLRARVVGSGSPTNLSQSGTIHWSGTLFSISCIFSCQVDVLDADGAVITTLSLEPF